MSYSITREEQRRLLAEARETIAARLENRAPVYEPFALKAELPAPYGIFVSLHLRGEDEAGTPALRGCVGWMSTMEGLQEKARSVALEAAFEDRRFPPLELAELPRCLIEISVLSPLKRCADLSKIQVGVHGLCLIYKARHGVFLPQVPVEQGWDREEYLARLCDKAGVPRDVYTRGAEVRTFTAAAFAEGREGEDPLCLPFE